MASREPSRELVLAVLAAGSVILAAHAAGIVICPVRRLFGVPCPGCGSTRAVLLLLRGDFFGAATMNPVAVALSIVVPLWWLFFRRREWSRGAKAAVLVVATVAVSASWAWKLFLAVRSAP